VDFDALLVDADRVRITGHSSHTFAANIGPVAAGVVLKRGWVTVQGTVGGRSYQFASTHLESGNAGGLDQLRAAQASELAAALGSGTPTILMGDLNDQPGSPMYQVLTGAGFVDVWSTLRPGARGYTCCHVADLSNQVADFTQRIDYVFARGLGEAGKPVLGSADILGDQPGDRVNGPAGRIWPSDHAGLAADLLLPPSP
jgi:endonuclease/exonuclease/phosphatase family metal-dependent hydrolase